MENVSPILAKFATENRNVRFVVDNYDVLVRAHRNKTILVMDEEVVRIFDNEVDAVDFAHKSMLGKTDYVIKKCSGPVDSFLIIPNGK